MIGDGDRPPPPRPPGDPAYGDSTATRPAGPATGRLHGLNPTTLTGAADGQDVEPADRKLPERFGRYRVTGVVGTGGFATVYKGYDDELRREVAIKVSHWRELASPRAADSSRTESWALATLDHPGIVPVYDVGRTEDGQVYLVSKLIAGGSLAARLKQGRLSIGEAAELVAAAAEAIHHAHERGLIHRDLKPANILLAAAGRPVVADFGLVLREEEFGTGPGMVGTPEYMSPEQARGEGHLVDARTDVYGLGVVLYELLTGYRPFRAANWDDLLELIGTQDPRPPRQLNDHVPRELDRICLRAVARLASQRYATAREFADDLRHWLTARGPGAVPASGASTARPRVVPKGLRPFDTEDADFFLGLLPGPLDRDGVPESVRFWKARLEETDPDATFRVGVLYGPSGCGKSSLVKAGLLPRLADNVLTLYVEAAPGGTEARLLRALRRRVPDLPGAADLADALAGIRRGRWLPAGQKVVLVIDQLEQWFHADWSADAELVWSLRQCDGGRVQALLLVRDDFWMSATRLARELEVPLQEGRNAAAVDVFDPPHARRVLAAFGRAFGALPPGKLSGSQERFLDAAVAELIRDGAVVPVRLSLLAEMVKGRPWDAATLRAVGGTAGLGVAFLEQAFAAPAAPPERRPHQEAARGVLRALLPEPGTAIKGRMRSYPELLAASGYAKAPREFDDLLRILDTELRLITPTEATADSDGGPPVKYYQLTHDYLVPALGRWLTAKERETFRGRVRLRLAEQAALWAARPDARLLPSWWEWAGMSLLTPRAGWTASERAMMAAATRRHTAAGLVVAAALMGVTAGGWYLADRLKDRDRAAHARGLVSQLMVADPVGAPAVYDELDGYRSWAAADLAKVADDPARPARERTRAALALLPADPGRMDYVYAQWLTAGPAEFVVMRRRLEPHRDQLAPRLWADAIDPAADSDRRLRAAAGLAVFDPADRKWEALAGPVAARLIKENTFALAQWAEALRPVRGHLFGPLTAIFRDRGHDPAERAAATGVLADYAADVPDQLTELVLDADGRQYAQLVALLDPHRDRVAEDLAREFETGPLDGLGPPERERAARRRANAAAALVRLGDPAPIWPHLKHTPDPLGRSLLIHALSHLNTDPLPLAKRWADEPEVSARRALLLALGDLPADRVPTETQDRVLRAFREDPDPGLHSTAEWALRQWGRGGEVDKAIDELRSKPRPPGRRWYVDHHGHTLVIVDTGPPPRGGPNRWVAVATREVTLEQYARFRPQQKQKDGRQQSDDCPVNLVSWFDAVAYCRWLSEQEDVEDDDMCYPPLGEIKPPMLLVGDHRAKTGYRLPSEAEWERACRSGTETLRPFGDAEDLIPEYVWFDGNSGRQLHPIGRLKPNDLGLFDMLGNAREWAHDADGAPADDAETVGVDPPRATRGGANQSTAAAIMSAQRDPLAPLTAWHSVGFRVVRTLPAAP